LKTNSHAQENLRTAVETIKCKETSTQEMAVTQNCSLRDQNKAPAYPNDINRQQCQMKRNVKPSAGSAEREKKLPSNLPAFFLRTNFKPLKFAWNLL
jgi:hypothetical protein